MKKHLSLLLAVLMLITSVGFNVIAAGECQHVIDTGNPAYCKTVYPTCEDQGYTIFYCTLCSTADNMVEVSRGNYTAALNHTYGEGQFEANDSGAYRKYFTCTRTYRDENGEAKACGHRIYENENGAETVYYLVNFVNNKVADTYESDVDYVKLAATYKSEDLASYYVKAGDTVVYSGINISHPKTKAYGGYDFIGWSKNADLEATVEKNLTADDCISLENVSENMTLYPVFAGKDVYYDVIFYSLKEQITNPQSVKHGESPSYRVNGVPTNDYYPNPTKAADLVNYYEFNGWSTALNRTEGIATEVIETTPVYAKINYQPTFKAVPKNYTVEFYTYENKPLQYNGANAFFDGIHLGTNLLLNSDIKAINENDKAIEKPSDETFMYLWTGKWRILHENGQIGDLVDLKNFNITQYDYFVAKDADGNTEYVNGTTEEKKIIRLVPDYDDRLIVYHVDVEMRVPDGEDADYYRGGAAVRVFDYNNQLIASGVTEADGTFRCTLNYRPGKPYTVKITTADSKYLGEAKINSLVKSSDGRADTEAALNRCAVPMELNPEYISHCSCIHHNALLQPIWVRILNLLHTFFNVKYECCYDMYSTIGPLLDYTKD